MKLTNKIKIAYKQNKNTPRTALSFNININEPEKYAGTYSLMGRLLLQGTANRSAQELSNELDNNAIELSCDMKQDFLRFRLVCLNEDLPLALEILSDIINNSDFEQFDKEKEKMNGEIVAELDSARMKALDNYYKTLFDGHFYGHTYTKILENLDKITKEDVKSAYAEIIKTGQKVLSIVGDFDKTQVEALLEKNFAQIANSKTFGRNISVPTLAQAKTVEIIKEDSQQAQIIQGWIFPTFTSQDYPALVLLNVILGSCGLSSRLFLELRDKKGLAYTVRSLFETYSTCASFSIYIATEPKNIQVSLDGFGQEIDKLKKELVGEVELQNAKNNMIGKQQFVTETNSQQANLLAFYETMGLGFDYQEIMIEKIKQVTPEQIKDCANKYFDDKFVVSILKP